MRGKFSSMTSPTRCGECTAEIPAGNRFCGQCGTKVPDSPPAADAAERRQITVVFCDLADSTQLSARLDPEDLRDVVRRYQHAVHEVVERFDGHVAQHLGDGVLIYFGYPRAHEDDARRAVTAGLEIVDALAELSRELEAERGVTVISRIGLHTGPVVTGQVGAGARTENLALGHTPNIAARVQGAAARGEVVLTEESYRLCGGHFVCEPLGPHNLRGAEKPVSLYRALRPRRGDGPVAVAGKKSPFVGRGRELDMLLDGFRRAADGHGRAVLVSGGPGLGKSRLLAELHENVQQQADRWVDCRCSPDHDVSAFYPILEYAERALEFHPRDDPADRLAKLEGQLESADISGPDASALLARLFSLPAERYVRGPSSPERDRKKTLELLVDIVRSWSRRGPVVFAIEDLHWADASTLELLDQIVARIADTKTFVVVTARPERAVDWTRHPHANRIDLSRLTDQEAASIVEATIDLSPQLCREVVERADGVPLFLEELARAVDVLIPSTLRDSLTAQLDALGSSKEVAQLASVLGRRFPYALLEAVSTSKGDDLRRALDRILESGLLLPDPTSNEEGFEFKHALIREAAYDSLLHARRRQLHDQVASALQAGDAPAFRDGGMEALAHHCEGAGRKAEAALYFEQVGAHAAESSANVEAMVAFRRAATLLGDLEEDKERHDREKELLPKLMAAISAHEGHTSPELPALYRRMREVKLALGEGDDLTSLVTFWGFHAARGDRRETLGWTEEILQVAKRQPGPFPEAFASFIDGWTGFYVGDQPRAIEALGKGLELMGNRLPDALDGLGRMILLAYLNRAWALALAGHAEQAWAASCTAVEHAEYINDPFGIAQACLYQGCIAQDLGRDPAEIRATADRVVELAVEYELGSYVPFGLTVRGWARAMLGEDEGIEEMRSAVRASSDRGDRNSNGHSFAMLASVLIERGELDAASEAVDACLQACAENLEANFEAEGHRLRAEILARRDETDAALASAERALEVARGHGARLLELRAATTCTRLATDDASRQAAAERLRAVHDELTEGLDGPDVRAARALLDEA